MKIGVYDSGIGGLTILNTLIDKFPNNEYVYYGDTLNIPYGNKTKEELISLSNKAFKFFISKNVDMVILACGTMCTNIIDYLENEYSIKIINIVSSTIKYINNSNYKNIGVIATTNTVKSNVFKNNVCKNIKQVECPLLVPIIEQNNYDKLDDYLDLYLKDLKDIDLLVLGCTHYKVVLDRIKKHINCDIIDMSININDISDNGISSINLYFTKLGDNILFNISKILNDKEYIVHELVN